MIHPGTAMLDLRTGRYRPMRRTSPLCSSEALGLAGCLVEEHPPLDAASDDVALRHCVVYLTLDEATELEFRSGRNSVTRRIPPGHISILPPECPYTVQLRSAGSSLIVLMEDSFLSFAAAEQGVAGPVSPDWVHGTDDNLARELVLSLRAAMHQLSPGMRAYGENLCAALAAHIVRRYLSDHPRARTEPALATPVLRRVLAFVEDNAGEPVQVADLARLAGLSTAHFARAFKRATSLSPHQCLLRCRIRLARQLLLNRSFSLVDVAAHAGFCDQAHLTRVFRRNLGTTPADYRRQHLPEARENRFSQGVAVQRKLNSGGS